MKKHTSLIGLAICVLLIPMASEAQLLKRIKETAARAAERAILNRTDEEVTKGTDKAIDKVLEGGKSKQEKDKEESESALNGILKGIFGNLENNAEIGNPDANTGKSGGLSEAEAPPENNNIVLPPTYDFSYELTVKVTNHQGSKENRYLLQPDQPYYAQVSKELGGEKYIIYDEANLTLLHFLEKQGGTEFWREKMSIFTVLRIAGIANGSDDTKVKNLASKSILGYEARGYEIATGNGVLQLWLTHDAPATMFKTMFSLRAVQKESPFRPNDMIMEMKFTSAADATKNFSWSCTSLNPYTKSFNITDDENL